MPQKIPHSGQMPLKSEKNPKVMTDPRATQGPIVCFLVERMESKAVANILSHRSDAVVRSGFQCAQPLHRH